jgi:hypothetical protein
MKYTILLLISSIFLFANTNRITTSDGITCENISQSPYEFESYIEASKGDFNGDYEDGYDDTNNNQNIVGIKFLYKFGEQKALNCTKLYNLELREKEAKVKELEQRIKALEIADNINWKEEK